MFYKYSIVEYNIKDAKVYLVCRTSLFGNKSYYLPHGEGLWCEFDDVNFYEALVSGRYLFDLQRAEKDFLDLSGLKQK